MIFFNWDPPKNHKYGKKLEYLNWDPPKNHKYGKKLKYPNWDPPKMYCTSTFFQLRNFRGVPVRMFVVFYLLKKTCDF